MRDIALVLLLCIPLLKGIRHPWIAVMVWVFVSVLNPHRFTYGFAYSMPFALAAAGVTMLGILITRDEKRSPFSTPSVILMILSAWICVTTALAFFPTPSLEMLERVLKIYFMTIVACSLIVTEKHIRVLTWVLAMSIGLLAAKGGVFTVLSGGSYRVWGPPSSFIADNNAFALATIMTVPLLAFLAGEAKRWWLKWGLVAASVLSVFSALGSHSRGALLAMVAMTVFLLFKGKRKFRLLLMICILVPIALAFLPAEWFSRMETIETYNQDASAMGRINAWQMAFNLANDRIFGGGFALANPFVFGLYAPNPALPLAAHSIYFQMLGEHGWLGLGLFLSFWIYTLWSCVLVARRVRGHAELVWVANLSRMIQVSLIAFAVGGAFLSLAYYDFPYYEAVLVVALRRWVDERLKNGVFTPEPSTASLASQKVSA